MMRWRREEIDDDTTPQVDRCGRGHRPHVSYGPISVISCGKCGETITVETPPFFRSGATQREHEIWRAVLAWNNRTQSRI